MRSKRHIHGMANVGELRMETANNPPARQAKPKRRSTIQAFLSRQGSKGGDHSLSGTAYEGQNAADILAKQSDMLEQIQHIMIEERWQHEQHSRVLENELQSLHDIIRKHEESEVGVRPPPPFPSSLRLRFHLPHWTPSPAPAFHPAPPSTPAPPVSQNKLRSKLTRSSTKKAPLAELPFGMPKRPSGDDALQLAEESKRIANEFKGEARQRGQSAVFAVPQLGSCASSGRAWRLQAARDTQAIDRATGRPSSQPPPKSPILLRLTL